MEHSTEILYNKTEVFCSAAHRFGSDALLLARFTEPKRSQKAVDLCSGCGIVSLEWHDRGHRGECAAVELQPEASSLLREALAAQGIDHITPSAPTCAPTGRGGQLRCLRLQPALLYCRVPEQRPRPRHSAARDRLHAGGCLPLRLPAAQGRRAARALPPARTAGRGAGRAAGQPLGAQAPRLCEEQARRGPVALLVEAQKNRKTGLRIQPDVLISAGAALYGNN